jgi:hypothetical protein
MLVKNPFASAKPPVPAHTKHRNERLRTIVAPVGGAMVAAIAVMVLLAIFFSEKQLGTVAACMSVIIFVPLIITCAIPYVILLALLFGVTRISLVTSSALHGLRVFAYRIHSLVRNVAWAIARPVIRLNQIFAWIESVFTRRKPLGLPERVKSDERR